MLFLSIFFSLLCCVRPLSLKVLFLFHLSRWLIQINFHAFEVNAHIYKRRHSVTIELTKTFLTVFQIHSYIYTIPHFICSRPYYLFTPCISISVSKIGIAALDKDSALSFIAQNTISIFSPDSFVYLRSSLSYLLHSIWFVYD